MNKRKLAKKVIFKIMIRSLVLVLLSLIFGSNVLLMIVPIVFYYLVKIVDDFVKITKNNFKGDFVIFERLLLGILSIAVLFCLGQMQIKFARKNFLNTVTKIKEYYKNTGKYPTSLEELKINKNPYFSLLGPEYRYALFTSDKSVTPIFCLVEVSPFGRRYYQFDSNEEVYMD